MWDFIYSLLVQIDRDLQILQWVSLTIDIDLKMKSIILSFWMNFYNKPVEFNMIWLVN